ncbi:hypothetical protein PMAYCL1PPCAC_19419, partial [Pristionchus mayeri]
GWIEKGAATVLTDYNHKTNKDVKLPVQCIEKCGVKFWKQSIDKVKYTKETKTMACDGTKMISYTIASTSSGSS